MASHLKRVRSSPILLLSTAEYRSIQSEYLNWIDARVRTGVDVEKMNRELDDAGVFSAGADNVESFEKSYAGFLGQVESRTTGVAEDLRAVTFGVFTGSFCGYDDTVVLYSRSPLRRVARINAWKTSSSGSRLRALTVGPDDPARGRIIASEWVASNCTSNWNGNNFRIDLIRRGTLRNALNRAVGASGADAVRISVEGDAVALNYTTMSGETADLLRPGIARYRIEDRRAVRQSPIAASYGGFIDEWLELAGPDAAQWSAPEAATRHQEMAAKFSKEQFEWEHAAACPGPPPTREIAVRWRESKQVEYFLVGGSTPAEMKMLSVSDQPLAACREIDIRKDRSPITSEPRP